jgi:hypothetical protein
MTIANFKSIPDSISELLEYQDGKLFWKVSRGKVRVGQEAGALSLKGYIPICVNGKRYYAHRIVWALFNGQIPSGMQIDHINCDPTDNRIENLRLATRSQNLRNAKNHSNNTTGFKGVTFYKRGKKYQAQIGTDQGLRFLGRFPTAELAHEAYVKASKEFHGEFGRFE